MTYYVVCYPQFAVADRRWIDDIRRDHDPQAAMIAPHVTLVFGLAEIDEAALVRHLRSCAETQATIEVGFSAIECHRGFQEEAYYAYLQPGRGRATVEALHDALHRGPLLGRGETAPAFVPHITLGRAEDRGSIEALVAAHRPPEGGIFAVLNSLTLVAAETGTIRALAEAPFAG